MIRSGCVGRRGWGGGAASRLEPSLSQDLAMRNIPNNGMVFHKTVSCSNHIIVHNVS